MYGPLVVGAELGMAMISDPVYTVYDRMFFWGNLEAGDLEPGLASSRPQLLGAALAILVQDFPSEMTGGVPFAS
jgi:hypothetical protein